MLYAISHLQLSLDKDLISPYNFALIYFENKPIKQKRLEILNRFIGVKKRFQNRIMCSFTSCDDERICC